ncbi:MAG: hypothetical protein MUC87_13980 [Bacteroidia bacterium]|nr:hypothetical protein [Bacteroidia bacterium]
MQNPVIQLVSKAVNGNTEHYLYLTSLFSKSGYVAQSYALPADLTVNPVEITAYVAKNNTELRQASLVNHQIPVTAISFSDPREIHVTIKDGTTTLSTANVNVVISQQDNEDQVRPIIFV